jgi:Holliday junction resolvasome RuvABC endonuclease subunit
MNEAETRAEHIDPALKAAGWGVVEGSRIRREYPAAGFVAAAFAWTCGNAGAG